MRQDLRFFALVLAATNSWIDAWAPPVVSSFSGRRAGSTGHASATCRYQHLFKGAPNGLERRKLCYREPGSTVLWSEGSNENDDTANLDEEGPDGEGTNALEKKYKPAHMGGRRKRKRRDYVAATNDSNDSLKKKFTKWATILAPILLLWVLFKSLFFGSDPSYVYYQSSVYESRSYGADGRVDTSRKESFRSNIPGLVEGRRLQENNDNKGSSSSYLLRQNPDESFEQELDSMMQIQKSMLRDFFP